jgi:hypothetical protein
MTEIEFASGERGSMETFTRRARPVRPSSREDTDNPGHGCVRANDSSMARLVWASARCHLSRRVKRPRHDEKKSTDDAIETSKRIQAAA